MPFCPQCGIEVRAADQFCAKCGTRQPLAEGAPDYLRGTSPRTAALLCYVPVIGWVASIVVLASARFRDDRKVRFHAFQGLYLFVAWLLIDWVAKPFFAMIPSGPMHFPLGLLHAVIVIAWVFMLVKVSHDETYRLPIVGELAERSVSEQR
ncbi:MAG: zinc-ribbon domain-containing protein [Acidobacteria bacterium]|nr:zinc-ribbon domain-containing protein [Acidobacteriota bacterium]